VHTLSPTLYTAGESLMGTDAINVVAREEIINILCVLLRSLRGDGVYYWQCILSSQPTIGRPKPKAGRIQVFSEKKGHEYAFRSQSGATRVIVKVIVCVYACTYMHFLSLSCRDCRATPAESAIQHVRPPSTSVPRAQHVSLTRLLTLMRRHNSTPMIDDR